MTVRNARCNDEDKNMFCLGLTIETQYCLNVKLWIRKHNNVSQHSIKAYLPLARCASHAERFER